MNTSIPNVGRTNKHTHTRTVCVDLQANNNNNDSHLLVFPLFHSIKHNHEYYNPLTFEETNNHLLALGCLST